MKRKRNKQLKTVETGGFLNCCNLNWRYVQLFMVCIFLELFFVKKYLWELFGCMTHQQCSAHRIAPILSPELCWVFEATMKVYVAYKSFPYLTQVTKWLEIWHKDLSSLLNLKMYFWWCFKGYLHYETIFLP